MKCTPLKFMLPDGMTEEQFIAATNVAVDEAMDRMWADLFGGSRQEAEVAMMEEIERRFKEQV